MKKRTKTRIICLSFLFWSTMLAGSMFLWLVLNMPIKSAHAAKTVEVWPFPQTVTVSGTAPLLCPQGYRQEYTGQKVGLLKWNFLPPATKPQIHRAPSHVCLSGDGDGHPFVGFAYVGGIVENAPCALCVLGSFTTN